MKSIMVSLLVLLLVVDNLSLLTRTPDYQETETGFSWTYPLKILTQVQKIYQ